VVGRKKKKRTANRHGKSPTHKGEPKKSKSFGEKEKERKRNASLLVEGREEEDQSQDVKGKSVVNFTVGENKVGKKRARRRRLGKKEIKSPGGKKITTPRKFNNMCRKGRERKQPTLEKKKGGPGYSLQPEERKKGGRESHSQGGQD